MADRNEEKSSDSRPLDQDDAVTIEGAAREASPPDSASESESGPQSESEPQPAAEPDFTPGQPPEPRQGPSLPVLLAASALVSLIVGGGAAYLVAGLRAAPPPSEPAEVTLDLQADPAFKAAVRRLAALEDRPEPAAGPALPDDLDSRLNALEDAVRAAAGESGSLSARLSTLSGRMDLMAARLPDVSSTSAADLDTLRREVVSLAESVGAVEGRIAQLSGEIANGDARLMGRIESVERQLPSELPDQLAKKAAAADVTALQERMETLERNDAGQDAKRAALAVAAATLTRAVASAGPFADELETVAGVAPDLPQLARLEAHAATGVPTEEDLRARFAREAVEALQARPEGLPWYTELWWSLKNIVAIRPEHETDGASVGAILSRAEARLEDGRLDAALTELDQLPVYSQAAMRDWIAAADARRDLNDVIRELNARVLQRLRS